MATSSQGAPRPVASIVGLVLGILAVIISWVPIVNNLAFIIGIVGVIFAIVGAIGVFRGKRAGKALAIAALAVNVISIVVVLGTQSMYSAAVDEAVDDAVNGPAATETSTGEEQATDLAVGTKVTLENGLVVSVDSVQTDLVNYDGSAVVGIQVTYTNDSDESASYNPFDWKGENADGAQESYTYFDGAENELSAGTLAAGGTVTGNIYFEGDTVKAVYFASVIADEPAASWALS